MSIAEANNMSGDIASSYQKWNAFENELIYSNRYFPNVDIFDDIKGIILRRKDTIVKGRTLFRAREYDLGNVYSINELDESSYIIGEDCSKISKKLLYSVIIKAADTKFLPELMKNPVYAGIINEREEKSEWGFSKEESGKPDREKSLSNRANPKYISYLYLASDIDTALAETRAQIEQLFSVAQYETTKDLKIINLTHSFVEDKEIEEDFEIFTFYLNVHRAFSAPVYSNEKDYIVSQYIAEYIKKLGFEGIVFDSSRKKGGINYTLFDDAACKFLRSELHSVENIQIESKRQLPL